MSTFFSSPIGTSGRYHRRGFAAGFSGMTTVSKGALSAGRSVWYNDGARRNGVRLCGDAT